MNILPKFCRSNATVNYSILNRFKPANIYRFFCLSLSRDDWYNVRITLDELKRTSGGKSVSSFNKKFEEYLDIKPLNPEKPDVPLNKNDAFQKVQKRRVQEKR